VLAILFRLVQGFALGGEVGPNTAYLVEAAPPHRRGLFVAFQYMSQDISILVSGLVGFVLASNLTDHQLDAWGWRAAFLLGALIVPFGLILRRELAETLHAGPSGPDAEDPPHVGRVVTLGLMMLAGGTIVTYGLTYLNTYSISTLHMATKSGFLSTIAIGLAGLVCDVLGGWLSDKFGRKRIMIAPWFLLLILIIPGFNLLSAYRTVGVLVGMTLLLQSAHSIATSSVLVSVTESLPRRIRCGSLGLIYAMAISTFGGTAQFMVAWLTRVTGNPLAPAWYMTGAVVLGLIAMLLMPETAPVRLWRRRA
jgi:MFS family permease